LQELDFGTARLLEGCIQKGKEIARTGQDQMPPLFCPTLDHALKGEFEIETQHANARLPLYGMGDAPAFVAKRRCTPSIVCLPLLTYLRHTNTRLSFITKVGTSPILNKLRHAEN
jgi:hypothetical protein